MDPLDRREEALAAALAVLKGIPGTALCERLPDFRVALDELPALVMLDGEDEAEPRLTGTMQVATRFAVVAACQAADRFALGAALNGWRGRVRAALGADKTLGGRVSVVAYEGCGEPAALDEEGSGPYGALPLLFRIDRFEGEFDPYSP
jgi:hypothetical protein